VNRKLVLKNRPLDVAAFTLKVKISPEMVTIESRGGQMRTQKTAPETIHLNKST